MGMLKASVDQQVGGGIWLTSYLGICIEGERTVIVQNSVSQ